MRITRRTRRDAVFPGSSAVEHSTVNRQVAGSNPARGAKFFALIGENSKKISDLDFRAALRGGFVTFFCYIP